MRNFSNNDADDSGDDDDDDDDGDDDDDDDDDDDLASFNDKWCDILTIITWLDLNCSSLLTYGHTQF